MSGTLFSYQAKPDLLAKRNILVSGANRGIGRAVSLAAAQHGAHVILMGRNETELAEVYDEACEAGYPEPAILPFDLATQEEASYQQLSEFLESEYGKLHGLVNNASILGQRTSLANTPWQEWLLTQQINLNAPFLLCKHLLPLLQAAETASIILTSSGVGRVGRAYWGAYAVSKFGTEGLMQVLADELGNTSKIRVNCINPGATNTAMRRAAYPAENPADNPLPEEITPLYLFLLGDDSLEINGESLDCQIKE